MSDSMREPGARREDQLGIENGERLQKPNSYHYALQQVNAALAILELRRRLHAAF